MGRILTEEDEHIRPHLIEYDQHSPSPKMPDYFIQYVKSIQSGLSEEELEWLDGYEYFIFNAFDGSWTERAVPGLRDKPNSEIQYIKCFNQNDYRSMMNEF